MPLLLTLTYFTPCFSVSIVNFEHLTSGWDEGSEKMEHYYFTL